MGKVDVENTIPELDDFEGETEVERINEKVSTINKDMRRRLEDRMDEVRLNRQLREYDFRDI